MISLKLDALDQILEREVILTECVRQVLQSWGYESPFSEETIANLAAARLEVRAMLENGITELAVPEKR